MINDPSTQVQFHLWYTVDFRPDSSGWRAKYEDATTGTESSRRVVGWLIQEDAAPSVQELMRRRGPPGAASALALTALRPPESASRRPGARTQCQSWRPRTSPSNRTSPGGSRRCTRGGTELAWMGH